MKAPEGPSHQSRQDPNYSRPLLHCPSGPAADPPPWPWPGPSALQPAELPGVSPLQPSNSIAARPRPPHTAGPEGGGNGADSLSMAMGVAGNRATIISQGLGLRADQLQSGPGLGYGMAWALRRAASSPWAWDVPAKWAASRSARPTRSRNSAACTHTAQGQGGYRQDSHQHPWARTL